MPSTQELNRRIKSVKSTRKITRAMQLVSAAKMKKSQTIAMNSRKYAHLAWELINNVAKAERQHQLLREYPDAKKIGIVLVTTNRGLVGSFNSNLIKRLIEEEQKDSTFKTELIVIGRKGANTAARLNKTIVADFEKHDATIPISEIYPIVKYLTELYNSGEYKNIYFLFNHFVSTLKQETKLKQILPIIPKSEHQTQTIGTEVIFEPNGQKVLSHLLPRILESQLYQAILESDASEHSARMMMMKSATDNAGELVDDLTLTFNQLRQTKITTELSEITAGRIALE
ncbi:MAG: ATP synthase F1 subunit gamma [Candidatus Doudnabacteria bacterium]